MPTIENIATTTLQLIRKRLADNIFKANPLLAWLLMRGRVKMASGGKRIDEPLIYAVNNTVQAYSGYDRLNVFPTEEMTTAQFAWRQIAASISISGLEDLMNSGEQVIFDLLKAKVKIAEMSIRQFLAEKVTANTATKDTTRDFLGLDELVEDVAGASQSVVGGINRVADTWWRNFFQSNIAAPWGLITTGLLSQHMTRLYLQITKGLTQPDVFLTDMIAFERYENENRDKLRFSDVNLMNVGFTNFRFKNATLMWDENLQTGTGITGGGATDHLVYGLNSEYLSVSLHPRRNFVMTPFVTPHDQDARVAQILAAGNMTSSNSRFQGVILERE